MTEDRNPIDVALDLFVFAPFGMFITVTEELPKLIEKGRTRLGSQVGMARMMGEMAAPHLQGEAEKAIKGFLDRVVPPAPPVPRRPEAVRAEANGAAPAPSRHHRPASPPTGPGAEKLAIPAYDTLSAMQVVQRLNGLDHAELEAVREYEERHRGRKTIINRADQLLSEAG